MQVNCDYESEIVIGGISGRFPKSANLDEFWQNLIDGTDMIGDANKRYDVDEYDCPSRMGLLSDLDKFDAGFFSLHAKQACVLDPRIRQLLEITYETIIDAGLHPTELQGSQTGVFVALCDTSTFSMTTKSYSVDALNKYIVLGSEASMLANRLSFTFDLHGPSYVVNSACSSSLVAIQQALQAIRSGTCEAAIVASAHTHHEPTISQCFHQLKMTSPDGKCKSFDASANGYVRSEAAAAIYICKKQAAKRSHGVLVHAATNSDGYKDQGITFPSSKYQEKVIREVYQVCGVKPCDVDYVEAHGSGTQVGDAQEMEAICKVFCEGRKNPLLVGSVKSNMGHSEPVAGLCGIVKIVLGYSAGVLPANLHYKTPNPNIPGLSDGRIKLVDKNQPFNARYVGLNSMGFGGTNVHLLMKFDSARDSKIWSPSVPIILVASGRTQSAVELFLDKTQKRCKNRSLVSLTHEICKHDTPRHEYRGYAIINAGNMDTTVETRDIGRQMWFILTGLGSQWPGMSRDLIKFEVFRESIKTSALVLLDVNFDLMHILESGECNLFEDFKNSKVSITTIQIALLDLLKSIGIHSDGIIGHSTGEFASAYADGCLTHQQTMLASYLCVRGIVESNLEPGMVAAVGLTWEEVGKRCPPRVWPAIYNAEKNVTIAGSPVDVKKFIKELESDGIFVKIVRSASFAFHSPIIAECEKLVKKLLEKIIPYPKARSDNWLSTSVPESMWDTDLAKYCSAEYCANNCVNPVYFYPTIKKIPENVVALEIAPHCFFQSILKTSLSKKAVVLGLIHVKSPDNCVYFLNSIGKCFIAGINLNVAALYDSVQFPLSEALPNISACVSWDHSTSFVVPHHNQELAHQNGIQFSFDTSNTQDLFLEGHVIDGKNIFPPAGCIWLAWKCFAQQNKKRYETFSVVFENLRFEHMIRINKTIQTNILVNIFAASGKFEITEGDTIVCSGIIRKVDISAEREMLYYNPTEEVEISGPWIDKDGFYQEMRLRGYGYSGVFQGIEMAHMDGKWAKVKWQGEWVGFIDNLLQTSYLYNDARDLYIPHRIQKLTIEPMKVMEHFKANKMTMEIKFWEQQKTRTGYGIECRALSFVKFNQKSRYMPPTIVEHRFFPYRNCSDDLSETAALESSIVIAAENLVVSKFILLEILKRPANLIAHRILNECVHRFAEAEVYLINLSNQVVEEENVMAARVKVIPIENIHIVKPDIIFIDNEVVLQKQLHMLTHGRFILYKGPKRSLRLNKEIFVISEKHYRTEENIENSYVILKRLPTLSKKGFAVINMDADGYSWVESAKETLKSLVKIERVYFVSHSTTSGIAGFFRSLAKEFRSEKLKCYHAIENFKLSFIEPSEALERQIEQDLTLNIYKNNTWGTFANITITKDKFQQHKYMSRAHVDVLIGGDLSSLQWIESRLGNHTGELVDVRFSALNFGDVMIASGKLSQIAATFTDANSECGLGIEFSGMYKGNRVCGLGRSKCLATHVDPKGLYLFDIPDNWSFEEAATVPAAHVTAFIALILKGRLQCGESVLIHSGSGCVGQAAIQIALSLNCKIFTTVSSLEKREFLKARFPKLTEECFTNSHEAGQFEYHINKYTNGCGVDLILNSLAHDKIQASLRCLSFNGRFVDTDKLDIFHNTSIGMSILAKGITVIGISTDFEKMCSEIMTKTCNYIREGIASELIKPFPFQIFQPNQLEEAFRYMTRRNHIGKVLIEVANPENSSTTISALPRTYFNSTKSYVIVGGLGGMGFELARWLVDRGARRIILSTRSGKTTKYQDYHLELWNRLDVKTILDLSNVLQLEGVKRLLENAKAIGPIGGIFNVAAVIKPGQLLDQTPGDFEEVIKCKADTTFFLDKVSRECAPDLDHFVVFSSINSARGSSLWSSYGFANSAMERVCEDRQVLGLPGLAVQWGAVGDVGLFYRTLKVENAFYLTPQRINSCLDTLDLFLQQSRITVSSYIPYFEKHTTSVHSHSSLVTIAANILGIKDPTKVNPKYALVDLGMDSLMAAELKKCLAIRANVELSPKDFDTLNFERLAYIDAIGSDKKTINISESIDDLYTGPKFLLKRMPKEALKKMKSLRNSKDVIFMVHPLNGTVELLEELVSQMDATVYGLECVPELSYQTVENIAAFYVNAIQKFQPEGPYKIGGYSYGVTVAFEMTLLLEAQNQTVSMLLFLDACPAGKHHYKIPTSMKGNTEDNVTDFLALAFLKLHCPTDPPEIHKQLQKQKTKEEKIKFIAALLYKYSKDLSLAEIEELFRIFLFRAKSFLDYKTDGEVHAKTILVKAKNSKTGKMLGTDYGLSAFCLNEADVIEVAGDHCVFYEHPTKYGIANILNKIFTPA